MVSAKSVRSAEPMTMEQTQQFTYYFYAGKMALEQREYDKALMTLRLCEALNPEDGQTHEYLGMLYAALGDKNASLAHLKKAYECEPSLWRAYAEVLLQPLPEKKSDKRRIVRMVEKAVKQEGYNSDNWDFLRQVYTATGKYKKAIKAQGQLDQILGYDAYSAINRYRIYVMWKKNQKAIAEIDRYLETDPTNLRFLLFRLELLEYTRAPWPKLEQAYQEILRLDPNNLLILNNYAYKLAISGGDLKQAERMSQRTIQADANNPTYLDTYGWILHLQGQDMLAKFYLKKALDNLPENAPEEVRTELENHLKALR